MEIKIVKAIKEHENGRNVNELCRDSCLSNASFYKWRQRYGVTYKSRDLTFVYIYPVVGNTGGEGGTAQVVEHKPLHEQHIKENPALYESNRNEFKLKSEYAAHANLYYNPVVAGNSADAQACMQQMTNLMQAGAQGSF